jgi:hypothetical protein
MPGSSGTPLATKLGVRPGSRVYLVNAPTEVRNVLRSALTGTEDVSDRRGRGDFGMVFARSRAQFARDFDRAARRLTPTGALWGCWPKRSSGVATDLNDREVREIGLGTGLVDVKVCAVTETWSGLKFVRRRVDRPLGDSAD